MRVITKSVTFVNGTAVVLGAITDAPARCAKIFIEPDDANTHKFYVGDASLALGTSTVNHVIKRVAKPSAADAVLDNYSVESQEDANTLNTGEFAVDGTTNEKARVTFFVE